MKDGIKLVFDQGLFSEGSIKDLPFFIFDYN